MNVSSSVVGSPSVRQGAGPVLSPVDRISEILFGLTLSLSARRRSSE